MVYQLVIRVVDCIKTPEKVTGTFRDVANLYCHFLKGCKAVVWSM